MYMYCFSSLLCPYLSFLCVIADTTFPPKRMQIYGMQTLITGLIHEKTQIQSTNAATNGDVKQEKRWKLNKENRILLLQTVSYCIDRNQSITPVYTTNKTPPPGPNLSTFGKKPLYSAPNPSSLITVPNPGHAQLYLSTDP